MSFSRRVMLFSATSVLLAGVMAGPAFAGHLLPATADVMTNKMVNNYRQTISTSQCTATSRTNGQHAPPFSFASCLPPAFLPNTQAALGPAGDSVVRLTAQQDNPSSVPDEGDILIEVHLQNVICIVTSPGCPGGPGSPYDPHPGVAPDIAARFRMRLSDHLNCPGVACTGPYTGRGTVTDFDFRVPVPCTLTAPPASCDIATSVDAVVGNTAAIAGGSEQNAQIFRIRTSDSGMNNIFGDADDREFAQQGLVVH